jgi:hypothetical protein
MANPRFLKEGALLQHKDTKYFVYLMEKEEKGFRLYSPTLKGEFRECRLDSYIEISRQPALCDHPIVEGQIWRSIRIWWRCINAVRIVTVYEEPEIDAVCSSNIFHPDLPVNANMRFDSKVGPMLKDYLLRYYRPIDANGFAIP